MATTIKSNTDVLQSISSLVKRLAVGQQRKLESELKRLLLMQEANELKQSVMDNDINMEDIVKEVKKVCNGKK